LKPKIYIETSIIIYLTARPSHDIRVVANQHITIEWWDTRRQSFDLFISEFVIAEATLGNPEAAHKRLEALGEIPPLSTTNEVRDLAKALMANGPIPAKAEVDALHIAVAAMNGMDYLLTWNCTHIANAIMMAKDRRHLSSTRH